MTRARASFRDYLNSAIMPNDGQVRARVRSIDDRSRAEYHKCILYIYIIYIF